MQRAATQIIDPKSAVVISPHELNFIKTLSRSSSLSERDRTQKDALRTKSLSRYKHWPNTLEAQREKKRKERERRLQEAEAAQQLLDDQEAQYQEEQRRRAIDRANRLLYQETDRAKSLTSAVLLSTVMKEREAQLAITAAKRQQELEIEEMWAQMEQQRLRELAERDEQLEHEKRQKMQTLAQTRALQLNSVREKQRHEKEEAMMEGERAKQAALAALEDLKQVERRKVERTRQLGTEQLMKNQEQLQIKAEQRRQEIMEEEKLQAYAQEKERMDELRKQKAAEVARQKQVKRDEMIKAQYDHLLKLKDAENQRTEKHVQELQEKNEEKAKQEAAMRKKALEDIKLSRQRQMERKKAELERQHQEDALITEQAIMRNKMLENEESELEKLAFSNSKAHQNYLRLQMAAREEEMVQQRLRELDETRLAHEAAQREDEMFEEFAQMQMSELARRGRSVVPVTTLLKTQEFQKKHLVPG